MRLRAGGHKSSLVAMPRPSVWARRAITNRETMTGAGLRDSHFRVLMIYDAATGIRPFALALNDAGFVLESRRTLAAAAFELHRGDFPVAVVHQGPDASEFENLLAADQEIAVRGKLVVLADRGTVSTVKSAVNGGAFAYVETADGPDALLRQVRRAFRQALGQRALAAAAQSLNGASNGGVTRFQRLIQHMPVMMNAFDDQGRVVAWNRECELVTGYSADEIIGNPHAVELLYPNAEYRRQMMTEWSHSGDFRNWELELTCQDGSKRTVAWSNISLALPIDGWHSWAIGVDVTDRRRAEEELRARGAELGRAMRLASLGELVAELAHEVKQPLYAIANYCDAMRQYLATEPIQAPERTSHCLDEIIDQTRRAAQVVDRVQRRIAQVRTQPSPHALAAIVRDAIGWLTSDVKRHGGQVVSRVSSKLPQVLVDRVQVEQVLVNLMRNGLEAMRDTPAGLVEITAELQTDKVCVTVADRGPGVSQAERERIFEPLYTTRTDGMGMGLAICRRIITESGGEMWFDDRAGGGAAFHFTLPIVSGAVA